MSFISAHLNCLGSLLPFIFWMSNPADVFGQQSANKWAVLPDLSSGYFKINLFSEAGVEPGRTFVW